MVPWYSEAGSVVSPLAAITAAVDAGPGGLCFPVISGTGQPGATLSVTSMAWAVQVSVDAGGHWTTKPLTMARPGTVTFAASYPDHPAGATGTVHVLAPGGFSVGASGTALTVRAQAQPGQPVELLIDDVSQGIAATGPDGTWSMTVPRPSAGPHTVTVRYAPTGCVGPSLTLTVTA